MFLYTYVTCPQVCFWTILILHCLHLKLHLVLLRELPLEQSRRCNFDHSSQINYCFCMCVFRLCIWTNPILQSLHFNLHLLIQGGRSWRRYILATLHGGFVVSICVSSGFAFVQILYCTICI